MKTRWLFALTVFALAGICVADLEITQFDISGHLAWSNAPASGSVTIEWASTPSGPWMRSWPNVAIPVTNAIMVARVPLFYRAIRHTYAPRTNGLCAVPFFPEDKTFFLANTGTYPDGYGSYQRGGPEHTFYVARYEVSNLEFVQFLNDAQANSHNERGTNTWVDNDGSVWASTNGPMLFNLSKSRIDYNASGFLGNRYDLVLDISPGGGTYRDHPVEGVTWYGSLKYCNWLTVFTGRGSSQRCYFEGNTPDAWYPVTASNWSAGYFFESEREAWIQYRGFRLAMNTDGFVTAFDEFYKAGAWDGDRNNRTYGFGRDDVTGGDANYAISGDPFEVGVDLEGTTPSGFYDGSLHEWQGEVFQTQSNANAYGIFDIAGNVMEWTEKGLGVRGGGHTEQSRRMQLNQAVSASPGGGQVGIGFRVVTTAP
jgi:hypothetical protein